MGPQGRLRRPWGEGDGARRALWGLFRSYSEWKVIPNGWRFRMEGHSEWMAVPMKPIVLRLLTILLMMIVIGNYLLLRFRILNSSIDKLNRLVILYTLLIVILQYTQYNVEFVQHQGRYLFPALLPFALFYVAGLLGWAKCLENCWPNYSYVWYWLPVLYIPTMVILSLHALYFTIIPAFS